MPSTNAQNYLASNDKQKVKKTMPLQTAKQAIWLLFFLSWPWHENSCF